MSGAAQAEVLARQTLPLRERIAWRERVGVFTLLSLLAALLLALVASAMQGAMPISGAQVLAILGWRDLADFSPMQAAVLLEVRLPRLLLAVLVGVGLALSGAAMQGMFRNPLADPGIVGVSSGAGLGAVIWIVLAGELSFLAPMAKTLGVYALPAAAFVGGLLATLLIYRIARMGQPEAQTFMLLMAGIAVGALSGAATGVLTYIADDQQLRSITFWMMGSLGGASWQSLQVMAWFMLPSVLLLYALHRLLDVLLLGESVAGHLGFEMKRARPVLIVLVSVVVGAAVSMTGMIGFIGLMAPHIARLLIGAGHRLMLPAAAMIGALLLVLADMAARTLAAPAEIPIGIITALLGAPFFLMLLFSKRLHA